MGRKVGDQAASNNGRSEALLRVGSKHLPAERRNCPCRFRVSDYATKRELEVCSRCGWPTGDVYRDLGRGLLGGEIGGESVANSLRPRQEERTMREPEL